MKISWLRPLGNSILRGGRSGSALRNQLTFGETSNHFGTLRSSRDDGMAIPLGVRQAAVENTVKGERINSRKKGPGGLYRADTPASDGYGSGRFGPAIEFRFAGGGRRFKARRRLRGVLQVA